MFKLFTDGGSRGNPGAAACAAIIFDSKNTLIGIDGKFLGVNTNNFAEYQGLIVGLKLAKHLKIKSLVCYLDSELVVKQVNGIYKATNLVIQSMVREISKLRYNFEEIRLEHVPRSENKHADRLVNLILDSSKGE